MPAETSIGMSQETRDRLDNYRTDGHHSIEEALVGLMEIVPPAGEILGEDACSYQECDTPLWSPSRPEDRGGVIQWWASEHDDSMVYGSAWFCSPEHAAAHAEKIDEMMPSRPDKVIVGGHEEMQTEVVGDVSFYIDGETKEIGIPVPGAFGGTDSHGNEYDYVGEPVYIWNAGKVRHSGVIDQVIHEEDHTAIILGADAGPVTRLNHPDEEKRQEHIENFTAWWDAECPHCSEEVRVWEADEVECGECGETFDPGEPPSDVIPQEVLDWRDENPR